MTKAGRMVSVYELEVNFLEVKDGHDDYDINVFNATRIKN